MEKSKAFNLTGEQVMAELTPKEVKDLNLSLPQMTPAAKRFVNLLAHERIQKAALLAACKKVFKFWRDLQDPEDIDRFMDRMSKYEKQLKSVIKQAGESRE